MRVPVGLAVAVLLVACASPRAAIPADPSLTVQTGTPAGASTPRTVVPASTPRTADAPSAVCMPAGSFGKRYGESVAYDPNLGAVVLFGGRDDTGPNGNAYCDMWRWTGTSWVQLAPATMPPGRAFGALFLDAAHKRLILHGGGAANADPLRRDTWSWDGKDWQRLTPAHQPPGFDLNARIASSAPLGPLDVVRTASAAGKIELQSWTWIDGDFVQLNDVNRPDSRILHSVAFDVAHGMYVVFGGNGNHGPPPEQPLAETWTFNGQSWTQLQPAHHPAAIASLMAYFPDRRLIVAWAADGTWAWDGTDWRQVATRAQTPDWDAWGSLVYDPISHRLLLLGAKIVNLGQTMAWDGTSWARVA